MTNPLEKLLSDRIWKPIAKTLIVAAIGAIAAYTVDRGLFDANLANELADVFIGWVSSALR